MTKQTGALDRPITLNGQTYTMRFSMICMNALMTAWDVQTDREVSERISKAQARDLPTIVWAALQTHHPDLTVNDVLKMLDDGGLDGIERATSELLEVSAPRPDPDEKKA